MCSDMVVSACTLEIGLTYAVCVTVQRTTRGKPTPSMPKEDGTTPTMTSAKVEGFTDAVWPCRRMMAICNRMNNP